MRFDIPLTPETKAKLLERAAAAGVDPARYVAQAIEEKLARGRNRDTTRASRLSPQKRIALLNEWAASHRALPYEVDDSRESIYEGRGE